MKLSLTDLSIRNLKWKGRYITYWDTNLKGFGVRVGKEKKTFVILVGTDRRLITIGSYPDMPLRDARSEAKERMIAEAKKGVETPSDAREEFIEDCRRRLKKGTVEQYKSYLDYISLPLGELTKTEIMRQLDAWSDKPTAQNYAYATVRNYLNWCIDRGYIEHHPLVRGRAPNKLRARSRVLTDEELGRVWRCTGDDTYGHILRLLILTGQRRAEVWKLNPEQVNDGLITFHTKGDNTNIIPVTPLIGKHLEAIPFKFNNWGISKNRFDTDCGVDFRVHDIRRTFASRLASLGVDVFIVERLLGHSLSKVMGTYQRYSFLPEKRDALLLWEAHIEAITQISVLRY